MDFNIINPRHKKFVLIHLIRAVNENKTDELTSNHLVELFSHNIESSLKQGSFRSQSKIYVKSLFFNGYIHKKGSEGIILTDKVFDGLQDIDKTIQKMNLNEAQK